MPVEGVYRIKGRGTVVTGRIERGRVRRGDAVEMVGLGVRRARSSGRDRHRAVHTARSTRASPATAPACCSAASRPTTCGAAWSLAAPKSVTPHTVFDAEVYVLTKDEGGRHTPFFNGYRPQFFFRTSDVTGEVTLGEGVEMVLPGDTVSVRVALDVAVAMEPRLRFAVREGGDGRLGRRSGRCWTEVR